MSVFSITVWLSGVVILVFMLAILAHLYSVSQPRDCSEYGNLPVQSVPARCLGEFTHEK